MNFGPPFGKHSCSLSPSWNGSLLAEVGWLCIYKRKAETHLFAGRKVNFRLPFGKHSCSLSPSWNGSLLAQVGWFCLYSKRKAEIHLFHHRKMNFGPPFGKDSCSLSPSWYGSLLAKVGWLCPYRKRKAEMAKNHVLCHRAGIVPCLQRPAGFAFTPFGKKTCFWSPSWNGSLLAKACWLAFTVNGKPKWKKIMFFIIELEW